MQKNRNAAPLEDGASVRDQLASVTVPENRPHNPILQVEVTATAEVILAKMRCAVLRSRLFQTEIESVGVALRGHLINPEIALSWLDDLGALEIVFGESA